MISKPTRSDAASTTGLSVLNRRHTLIFLLGLFGVLLVLFHASLNPGQILFSNDGPLGISSTAASQPPGCYVGIWGDLNWLGGNGGTAFPGISSAVFWLVGPVGFAKVFAPFTLFFLGVCAWIFFRSLNLSPVACTLGGMAAALNSNFFSASCWGVLNHTVTFGLNYLALAALVGGRLNPWLGTVLAGFAVGLGLMEGFDIGAIFSLFVAAFAVYQGMVTSNHRGLGALKGMGRTALVAVCAALIAAQALVGLVGTQIKGIVGTGQNTETKAEHWDWATQWSLPKCEALSFAVPGLFGYRMDTPGGGNYWGAIGSDPNWQRWFASDQKGPTPTGFARFSGNGFYTGVLVLLIAAWAVAQSARKSGSAFSEANRRLIWFWAGVALVSLLLAFGRFAMFYQWVYQLPYFSTIRNPVKFTYVVNWALVVLFAYGIHGLSRRYLDIPRATTAGLSAWWQGVRGFDRHWTLGLMAVFAACGMGCLVYASSRSGLTTYLQKVQFDGPMAEAIATYSLREAWVFLLRLAVAAGALTLLLAGWFGGARAKWGALLLGGILVADLGQANRPWIVYWDYQFKYATNPVIDFFRNKPHEHRMASLPFRVPPQFGLLDQLYRIEWAQHHFPYYNIQSLDIIQMSRTPEDFAAWEKTFGQAGPAGLVRKWELTNTRYLLAPTEYVGLLNQQVDPERQRFKPALRFDIQPKPGVRDVRKLEELTAVPSTNGIYAVVEFTGALPRVSLYARWQVETNDSQTLATLASPTFDPAKTVLVATPPATVPAATSNATGTVEYVSYAPKDIVLKADASTPSILLLNDRYDPNWKVFVDGQAAPLLRCNYLMRGVYLQPGTHRVEFLFAPSVRALQISLAAIIVGILLLALLFFLPKSNPS